MRRQHGVLVESVAWWFGYVAVLAAVSVYTAWRFAPLYAADALVTEPELSAQYRSFVGVAGVALAICLGAASAAYGARRGSVLQGLVALALGAGTTVLGLSVVPLVRIAEEESAAAAVWVTSASPVLVLSFAVASVAAWLFTRVQRPHMSGA